MELLLRCASRFYQRQLTKDQLVVHGLFAHVRRALTSYFLGERVELHELLTVQYLADELLVSPTYQNGLLRVFTGLNTQHIQQALLERAKDMLSTYGTFHQRNSLSCGLRALAVRKKDYFLAKSAAHCPLFTTPYARINLRKSEVVKTE